MTVSLKKIILGEMCLVSNPTIISTVVGSCVCVCIYSIESGHAGLIHFGLPDRSFAENSFRGDLHFGDLAILELVNKLRKYGGAQLSLQAKILGGGDLSDNVMHSKELGKRNVEVARRTLASLRIPVVSEDVGGPRGREIFFYTESGRVRVAKHQSKSVKEKVKVLVVDDSRTIQQLLSKVINSESIEVVGLASSAEEAMPLISRLRPDVITLDIHMPGMNGVGFLEKYLPVHPIPTIMISSIGMEEGDMVLRALELGAVDYIQKPTLEEISSQSSYIKEKIKIAAGIKVQKKLSPTKAIRKNIIFKGDCTKKILAIGSSTGGTEAIKTVLMSLPSNIPPILIVQHIPPVFSMAFARRLNDLCPFEVKEAVNGDKIRPGRVLIAPGGYQMEVKSIQGELTVSIFEGEKVNRHRPSVDVLFDSVANNIGKDALGVILTGMGDDGAKGLLKMKNAGAYTIAQDEASCVVYGMPKAAVMLGAVIETSPLLMMGDTIIKALEKVKVA